MIIGRTCRNGPQLSSNANATLEGDDGADLVERAAFNAVPWYWKSEAPLFGNIYNGFFDRGKNFRSHVGVSPFLLLSLSEVSFKFVPSSTLQLSSHNQTKTDPSSTLDPITLTNQHARRLRCLFDLPRHGCLGPPNRPQGQHSSPHLSISMQAPHCLVF